MSYILIAKMQYLHLTGIIPRMNSSFESDWERENKERFKRNHPLACSRDEEEKELKRKYIKNLILGVDQKSL